MKLLKDKYIYLFIGIVIFFFYSLWINKFPIPSDALVGLYHPWRDFFADSFPNGIPFKNPLITDPMRQQYPYRELAISLLRNQKLALWNPYSFAGTPLFANIQTALLYPLNILFLVFPFAIAWSILIVFQPLLAGVFTYLYLKSLKLDVRAAFMGALAFAFSGFMIAWQQWNTIGHVALWLPLILLVKDKLLEKFSLRWALMLIFAESSMILAGHLQTAFYIFIFTTIYLVLKVWYITKQPKKFLLKLLPFGATTFFVLCITSIQLIPTFQFIFYSARNFDLPDWQRADWFIPPIHLIQFIAPDFFGNPATGNYWGVWNYGEFVGYIGIIPILLALFGLIVRRDKKTFYFGLGVLLSLLFGFPTIIGKLAYRFNIPFIATMQPSRIIIIIDFCLAVLASLGFDYMLKKWGTLHGYQKRLTFLIGCSILGACWFFVLYGNRFGVANVLESSFVIAKRNLILPTLLFIALSIFLLLYNLKTVKRFRNFFVIVILILTAADLIRFGWKFTPFTKQSLLFPNTKVIEFLQQNLGNYRFMTTDRRIMPPNVATVYRIQDVSGYDPLYLQNYGELVAAWTRDRSDITPGSFNRILTPENYDSFFADLLGVKYVLSLKEEEEIDKYKGPLGCFFDTECVVPERNKSKLKLVFQEGDTRIYENMGRNSYPKRAFIVEEVISASNKQDVMKKMFEHQNDLGKIAIAENFSLLRQPTNDDYTQIEKYEENQILIKVGVTRDSMLVLTDIYYPGWRVFIDGNESTIIPVDYAFRGVVVPRGFHQVEFRFSGF